jgi:hypothetical protein
MLKVVHDADASNENGTAGGSLLDEIVRDLTPKPLTRQEPSPSAGLR